MVQEKHRVAGAGALVVERPTHSNMRAAVRVLAPAWPRVRIVLLGHAGVDVRAIGPRPVCIGKGAGETVLCVIVDAVRLVQSQGGVGKGAVDDAAVAAVVVAAVGAKGESVVGAPDGGVGEAGAGVCVGGFVPVGLGAGVVAFGLEEVFVGVDVVAVPGEEGSDAVDNVGLGNVGPL